jgi:nicotinate-nucleotide adenylyltransferase
MVELACQGNSAFVVSKIEIDRAGVSYTVTTLEVLHHMYGGDLFFILGGDALADLPRWYQASRIPELAHLVAVGRPGAHVNTQQLMSVLPSLTGRLTHIAGPEIHLSSTIIRRRAAKGQSLRYLMPDPVVDYIASHRLYSTQVE